MSRPQDSRFPYLPGIDALRALAVLAVFFYHSGALSHRLESRAQRRRI